MGGEGCPPRVFHLHFTQMITQVVQFKNLDAQLKSLIEDELDPERMIYVVKDNLGNVKSLTTSIFAAIKKIQAK